MHGLLGDYMEHATKSAEEAFKAVKENVQILLLLMEEETVKDYHLKQDLATYNPVQVHLQLKSQNFCSLIGKGDSVRVVL